MTTFKLPKPAFSGAPAPFVGSASFQADGRLQINGSVNDAAIRGLGVRHDGYERVDVFIAGEAQPVAQLDFKHQVAVGGNPPVDLYNSVVSLTADQRAAAQAKGLSFKIHLNQGDDLETDEAIRVGGTPPPSGGGSTGALGPNVPGPTNPLFASAGLRVDGTLSLRAAVNDEAIRRLGTAHDGFESIEVSVAGQKVATLRFETEVVRGGNPPTDLYAGEVKLSAAQQAAARAGGLSFKVLLNRGGSFTRDGVPVG